MAVFQPPPTWAEVVLVDKITKEARFNPVWLKWFIDLVGILDASGGGSGAIVHNSTASLQGGTANQYYHLTAAEHISVQALVAIPIAAGTYTPTLTNAVNISASTAYQAQYIRVGATCFVSGKVDVDPTAVGAVDLGISLPIASNFGAVEDCGGAAAAIAVAGQSAAVLADVANDRASMQWTAVDVANRAMFFSFGYQII